MFLNGKNAPFQKPGRKYVCSGMPRPRQPDYYRRFHFYNRLPQFTVKPAERAEALARFEVEVADAIKLVERYHQALESKDPKARCSALLQLVETLPNGAGELNYLHYARDGFREDLIPLRVLEELLSAGDIPGALEVVHRVHICLHAAYRFFANTDLGALALDESLPVRQRVAAVWLLERSRERNPTVLQALEPLLAAPSSLLRRAVVRLFSKALSPLAVLAARFPQENDETVRSMILWGVMNKVNYRSAFDDNLPLGFAITSVEQSGDELWLQSMYRFENAELKSRHIRIEGLSRSVSLSDADAVRAWNLRRRGYGRMRSYYFSRYQIQLSEPLAPGTYRAWIELVVEQGKRVETIASAPTMFEIP